MKNKRCIFKYILADTVIFLLLILCVYFVLTLFKLTFRPKVVCGLIIIFILGFIAGVIQPVLQIKKRILKIILLVPCAAAVILGFYSIFMCIEEFAEPQTYVVEREGFKYVVCDFERKYEGKNCIDHEYHKSSNFLLMEKHPSFAEVYEVGEDPDSCEPKQTYIFGDDGKIKVRFDRANSEGDADSEAAEPY